MLKAMTTPEEWDYEELDPIESVEKEAKRKGLVVVYPGPNQLFIDIDSEEALELHERLLRMFQRAEPCYSRTTPSPSGRPGHFHVVVTMKRPVKDAAERVMLQALLGSDPKRELLGYQRVMRGCEERRTSLFFEKPEPEVPDGTG